MRAIALGLLLLLATLPAAPAGARTDFVQGPDAPTLTEPVATVVVFDEEEWRFTAGPRTHSFTVPSGWNRVVMTYHDRPDGDPWDRMFLVAVEGAEVLRGTTPRTEMTLTKDLTRYASLMPAGATADVTVDTSSWESPAMAHLVTVTLRFYLEDATTALAPAPAQQVVPVFSNVGMCRGSVVTRTVDFPAAAPGNATLEMFLSNHGAEEAQFAYRSFGVFVDGALVAKVDAHPYVYAILGFYGGNDLEHPLMWWTAQRVLDLAGVHTGPGEIPSYKVPLSASQAAMLTGTRTVEVRASVNTCLWVGSLSVLLDA